MILGVGKKVMTGTITATTSVNGNIRLPGMEILNHIVLSAIVVTNTSDSTNCTVAIPYRYSSAASGNWGIHCINDTDGAARANMEFTIRYAYIEW